MDKKSMFELGLIKARELKKYEVDTPDMFYISGKRFVQEESNNDELYRYAVVKRLNTIKNCAIFFTILVLIDLIVGLLNTVF